MHWDLVLKRDMERAQEGELGLGKLEDMKSWKRVRSAGRTQRPERPERHEGALVRSAGLQLVDLKVLLNTKPPVPLLPTHRYNSSLPSSFPSFLFLSSCSVLGIPWEGNGLAESLLALSKPPAAICLLLPPLHPGDLTLQASRPSIFLVPSPN